MRTRWALTAIAGLLIAALLDSPSQAQDLRQRGEAIARERCSSCHAIGRTGDSPHPAAPRFRSLDNRTDLSQLSQRLRQGLITGHQDMPMLRFNRDDADAMVAYMRSVQAP
jgi:cytochrome c